MSQVIAVAAGGYHSVFLLENGETYACDDDDVQIAVKAMEGAKDIVAVACGSCHTALIDKRYKVTRVRTGKSLGGRDSQQRGVLCDFASAQYPSESFALRDALP